MTDQQLSRKQLFLAIGSILGVLASILGVIAVFFPDAMNLSKKRIANFSVQVNSPATVSALDEFLESQMGNIVKLDVGICEANVRDIKCPRIEFDDDSLSANFSTETAESCDTGESGFLTGVVFYFNDVNSKRNVWSWEKFGTCEGGNENGFGTHSVSGYFLVPSSPGFGQGWTEWLLTPISAKDIQLKEY